MAAPSLFKVQEALFDHLKDNYTTSPIAWPNVVFDPKTQADSLTGWVRPAIIPIDNVQETINGDDNTAGTKVQGFLQIAIFTPVGVGPGKGYEISDELTALFNKVNLTLSGNSERLSVLVPKTFQVKAEPQWFHLNLNVDFHYHT